jgi:hypothetical protein
VDTFSDELKEFYMLVDSESAFIGINLTHRHQPWDGTHSLLVVVVVVVVVVL